MPPTTSRSVQCWYNMIMSMIYTGVAYMSTGQLHKQWLEDNYQTNLVIIQAWYDNGLLTADQLMEYKQLGEVIKIFNLGPVISTPITNTVSSGNTKSMIKLETYQLSALFITVILLVHMVWLVLCKITTINLSETYGLLWIKRSHG